MIDLIKLVDVLFVVAISGGATASVLLELMAIRAYRHSLGEVAKPIDYLAKYLNSDSQSAEKNGSSPPPKADAQNLKWIARHLAGQSTGDDFLPKIENGSFVLLQYPSIIAAPVPRSPVSFAPNLLTSLGVLGTFAGIFLGLQKIGVSSITEPQQLLASSTQLLEGMKLAFVTSLLGLGNSIFLILLLAWGERRRRYRRDKLRNKLNQIAFLETPERLLSRITPDASRDAAGAIVRAAQTMRAGFTEIVTAQQRLNPEKMGHQVGVALIPVFEEIRQELATLRQIKADQGEELLKSLIWELRTGVIEPVVERLDATSQLTQEASLAVRELKNELGGISQSLAESILTIQSFQKDTVVQLQDFAGSLQQILGEFQTDTKGVLQEMAAEIQQGVDQSIEGMKEQRSAFKQSAEEAAATFRGIREDLQAGLHTQAELEQQRLQGVQERMVNILKAAHTAFQSQSSTIQAVGQEASKLMADARENLVGSLRNVDGMLQNTRLTVQQELERFRESYQASLLKFFSEQNNLLESTLGEQQRGLAQVVVALQSTFREEAEKRQQMLADVDRSMTKIQDTTEKVCDMANGLGLNSSERLQQLQELSRTIGVQAQQVESAYRNMVGELNQVLQSVEEQMRGVESAYQNLAGQFSQALELGNHQMIGYLDRATESQTRFFNEADVSMAEVCAGLQETSTGLMQVAQYLVAAADNLGAHNGSK